jgi:hypothetical protein
LQHKYFIVETFGVGWPPKFYCWIFLQMFPFCHQNLCVDWLYDFFDFGIDIYGVWIEDWYSWQSELRMIKLRDFSELFNLGCKSEFFIWYESLVTLIGLISWMWSLNPVVIKKKKKKNVSPLVWVLNLEDNLRVRKRKYSRHHVPPLIAKTT